jgi:hypothetical protein
MPTPAGALPPTGRTIDLRMTSMLTLDADGRVVEEHRYFDTATMFRQLGLV